MTGALHGERTMFDPVAETMPRDDLATLQLAKLRRTVERTYESVPAVRKKFDAAGARPEQINTLADLVRLPFSTKADLRDNFPFGLFAVPREDLGQTLGHYGVPHGPYLVVPIFGGLSLRDLGGRAGDSVVSPTGWEYIDLANREWVGELDWEWQTAITVTDTMSSLPGVLEIYGQMKQAAVDPYLSVRDATRRYRDAETAR